MEGADERVKIMCEDIYRACLEYHGHGGDTKITGVVVTAVCNITLITTP
jgi:hypothetical protein